MNAYRKPRRCLLLAPLAILLVVADAKAASIKGTVWCAGTEPGCGRDESPGPERVEGIEISLCDENGDVLIDDLNGSELRTTTAVDGSYLFENLRFRALGRTFFLVKVTGAAPDGKSLGSINCRNTRYTDTGAECVDTAEAMPEVCGDVSLDDASIVIDMPVFALDRCNTIVEGIDFVYCGEEPPPECEGRLGDLVWQDLDGDAVRDEGELGIPDVRVVLCDEFGNELAETITGNEGEYLFEKLCAGKYTVKIDESTVSADLLPCPCEVGDNRCSPAPACLTEDDTEDLTLDFCYEEPPPPPGGQGCTPGYWKQPHHLDSWPIDPETRFDEIFDDAFGSRTLLEVLRLRGGGIDALGRHTVAAFLNALGDDVAYDLNPDEVVEIFNDAFPGRKRDYNAAKAIFEGFNEQGCPLRGSSLAPLK